MKKDLQFRIRPMTEEDYDKAHDLWMTIHGFGIRSIDDSKEGVGRFLRRNPNISAVAEAEGKIVGTILCGHDGRTGSFYHVCVHEDYRRRGIGKAMAIFCMKALQNEKVNKVSLVAFVGNELGNKFWHEEGWTMREDVNTYDFILNDANITRFNS
ncbi:MAG: GNAT family N-acetyltransferase [Lachnospiraceae bacterium]|nr:GNAT family N-acetyltransferase [Lachnospiraceae bacterium]